MTRSYCTSARLNSASPCGVSVTDHLFSDQPVGIGLDIQVRKVQRELKQGESQLQWKRGFYGKSATWQLPPPSVEVANARRNKCQGMFSPTEKFGGYDVYTNKPGACIFFSGKWKISENYSKHSFVYFSDVASSLPPLGCWSGVDANDSCDVFQGDPDAKRSSELYARRMRAESSCQDSMPKIELTFEEAVARKMRALERKTIKNRRVRLTMKSKQESSSSSSDCESSLSSDSASSSPDLQEMVAAMAPDGWHVSGAVLLFVF